MGAVLLSGATGFVGMELLARFLERGERRVYARVRYAARRFRPAPRVEDYFDRLLAFAEAARWGRRKVGRREARRQAVPFPM